MIKAAHELCAFSLMILTSQKNKHARKFVERKLVIRLYIFFVILVLLLGIIMYEIGNEYIPLSKTVSAFSIGVLTGVVFSRRKKIFWQEETAMVIARMDSIGIILLVVYVAYIIFRHEWLAHWFYGHELTAFSFSLAACAMAGRVFNIRRQIRRILKRKKILIKHPKPQQIVETKVHFIKSADQCIRFGDTP